MNELSDRNWLRQNVGQLSLNGDTWQGFNFDAYTNALIDSKTVFIRLKKDFENYSRGSVLKIMLKDEPTIVNVEEFDVLKKLY